MPVKSKQNSKKTVSRIEWRMQDTETKKIYHRVYPTEERAQWHARKFNESGMQFNSTVRTQVVRVKSTYALNWVEDKTPITMKVLK